MPLQAEETFWGGVRTTEADWDGDWIGGNYRKPVGGHASLRDGAVLELLAVIMHEAGRQFGYENPHGMSEGCGNGDRCHDHYGSGGIMSHDDRIRIDGTPEDVERVRISGFEAHYHEDGFAAWRDHVFSDWGTSPAAWTAPPRAATALKAGGTPAMTETRPAMPVA